MKSRPQLWTATAVAVLVMAIALWVAVTRRPAPTGHAPGTPRVEFDQTSYNFGLHPPDKATVLEHAFVFRNTGDAPLRILSAGQACRIEGHADSLLLAPGDASSVTLTAELPASYVTSPRFERNVKIQTNDPLKPAVELSVRATFAYSIAWQPENIDLGTFVATDDRPVSITLVSRLPVPFRILSGATGRAMFDVVVPDRSTAAGTPASGKAAGTPPSPGADMSTLLSANPLAVVTLKPKPGVPAGPFVDVLEVHTDRQDIPVVSIPVSGQVASGLTVEPREVFFGIVRSAKIVEKEVRIASTDPEFSLKAFSSPVSGLQGRTEKVAGGGYRLLLTLDPTVAIGPFEGEVVLQTEPASQGEIRIRVWGLVKMPARSEEAQ